MRNAFAASQPGNAIGALREAGVVPLELYNFLCKQEIFGAVPANK